MTTLIERITGDKYLKYLLGLSAYFFLVLLIQNALGREISIPQYIFLTLIALLVIRIGFLLTRKNTNTSETGPKSKVIRNAVVTIGYLALIAIILGNGFHAI